MHLQPGCSPHSVWHIPLCASIVFISCIGIYKFHFGAPNPVVTEYAALSPFRVMLIHCHFHRPPCYYAIDLPKFPLSVYAGFCYFWSAGSRLLYRISLNYSDSLSVLFLYLLDTPSISLTAYPLALAIFARSRLDERRRSRASGVWGSRKAVDFCGERSGNKAAEGA